jgi:putative addiction module CopG family antidote
MTISLRPEHEQFIQTQLSSGRYATVDEVLSQAFQLLDTWQQDRDEWIEITCQKVTIGQHLPKLKLSQQLATSKDSRTETHAPSFSPRTDLRQ